MARRQAPEKKAKNGLPPSLADVGDEARDLYKARLTRGLLGVDLGEGYIVEILNYRTKRVLRRDLFETREDAREDIEKVREDIKAMTIEEFRRKYLQPPA